jgi:SagB-type dehydrogenase family enzyme
MTSKAGISAAEIWREYHESTKHSVESLRRAQHVLDWANMPDPFRHYEGVPVLDLPADPPAPQVPAFKVLEGSPGTTFVEDGATFLSQLLFYSAAISASKLVASTGYRYALRVNPSSGNLHPTEFHFLTRGLKDWPDGLYHYRPSSHMAEQRAVGSLEMKLTDSTSPIVFILTSIVWREAWKYGERAYRYCLHDMGHAWQALALAARAMGCDAYALGDFPDDEVAHSCRLSEDEWPMLIIKVHGQPIPKGRPEERDMVWFGGDPNQLSGERIEFPLIRAIHSATGLRTNTDVSSECSGDFSSGASGGHGEINLPSPDSSIRSFGETVRARRSALDFLGGARTMSLAQLATLLHGATQPFSADFADTRFVHLYLYVHRVDELPPGLYRFWEESATLEKIKAGDQRVMAAGLSLGQQLAGNACVTFSMAGDLELATQSHGDRGYRYAYFEAGAIGQRLYLAAEALGLGATGIGAFYDDEVNRYLDLDPRRSQVLYHFAIGYPIPDPRLSAKSGPEEPVW